MLPTRVLSEHKLKDLARHRQPDSPGRRNLALPRIEDCRPP